jgi:hypothetical protein
MWRSFVDITVPQYCCPAQSHSSDGYQTFANALLVESAHGLFVVNKHFLSSGEKHFVTLPNERSEHRLVACRGLVNVDADIALMSIEDPSAVSGWKLPEYADPPRDLGARLTVVGHKCGVVRIISARFLGYPIPAGHVANPPRFDGYQDSILCGLRGIAEDLHGLSGSVLIDKEMNVLGLLSRGRCNATVFTPSFEIERLISQARKPSFVQMFRSMFA